MRQIPVLSDIKQKKRNNKTKEITGGIFSSLLSASRDTYPYMSFDVRRIEIVSGCLGETADFTAVEREITNRERGRKTKQCHASLSNNGALI